MKRAAGFLLLLSVAAIRGSAQAVQNPRADGTEETQKQGFWIDPSTGLIWAARDNGKGVSWKRATKYCRDLRLAGHSDWRLGTLAELEGIYDKNASSPGRAGKRGVSWYVKGNLFLTGHPWSSNYWSDDRGRNSGYSWYFDFGNGRPDSDPSGFPYPSSKRALCVRGK